MRRISCIVLIVVSTTCVVRTTSAYYGLDGYRDALVEEHGPFVAGPTYLGAAVGAVLFFPFSLVNGTLSLVALSRRLG